jgi:hypothetical protein
MKSVKILTALFTFLLLMTFTNTISAQTDKKATTKPVKPTKVSPKKKMPVEAEDCVNVSPDQVKMMQKACDEMRFMGTQDAKVEPALIKRCEDMKKIVSGDATAVCKLYETVKKSKKACGKDKEMLLKFAGVYEM